ncbi:MAG: hypothetical protein BGO07_03715 [Alphaproteobacteria bacterium 40-19]|nr:MAG: hypothetical protein BGO07_03715 [Alphaproteobacteria bacterium 40-19]
MIQILSPQLINQIAAGEVVERPASVVKELLENALDAGAKTIHLSLRNGGQSLIRVQDDGVGMNEQDLKLSVQRHATSKLPSADLWNIQTFGFRGEALAAISSIARLSITSRCAQQDHGWTFSLEAGQESCWTPSPCAVGTVIEVKDLFFATPARLKFMRSPLYEQEAVWGVVEKMMLAHPEVSFYINISVSNPKVFPATSLIHRIQDVLKKDFLAHSFEINESLKDYTLTGWVGLPSFNRYTSDHIFLFVNKRPVRDKLLLASFRQGFSDLLPKDRHPCGVLFLSLPYHEVDVNVHPAKTEVRFKDPSLVRQFLISSLKKGLMCQGQRIVHQPLEPETTLKPSFTPPPAYPSSSFTGFHSLPSSFSLPPLQETDGWKGQEISGSSFSSYPIDHERSSSLFEEKISQGKTEAKTPLDLGRLDLGRPLGQIHRRYIICENAQGLICVDPHGAHERLLYEEMKKKWVLGDSVLLLHPIDLKITFSQKTLLQRLQAQLKVLGVFYDIQEEQVSLKGIPCIFESQDPAFFAQEFIASLQEIPGPTEGLEQENLEILKNKVLGHWACKRALFLGTQLTLEEMDSLLRQMEACPVSGYCNHGRRVYYQLSIQELSKLFDRR